MAVELMGVQGEKILDDEKDATTQDFVIINHPVFFVRNAIDCVPLEQALLGGSPLKVFFPGLNPLNWRIHELRIANAIKGKKVDSPLDITADRGPDDRMGRERVGPCTRRADHDPFTGFFIGRA